MATMKLAEIFFFAEIIERGYGSPYDTPTCAGVLTQLTNIFRVRTRKMRYGANNKRAMRTARALRARQNRGPRHPTLRAAVPR